MINDQGNQGKVSVKYFDGNFRENDILANDLENVDDAHYVSIFCPRIRGISVNVLLYC